MPADTFSSILGWLVMGTGNDNNNWGDNWNNQVGTILEDAIARLQRFQGLTGGTLDLSGGAPPAGPSQARYAALSFNGALTSNLTVIVPNLSKIWLVFNNTSGNSSLLMKTPSGTARQVPQGTNAFRLFFCDGFDGIFRQGLGEVGTFLDFAGTTAPPGTLECDGSAISRLGYPDLYAAIGTTWGAGDGFTTFNLPNLKDTGRFRRSRTGSVGVGTYQANQIGSHTHTGSVTVAGSATTSGQSQSHTHAVTLNDPGHSHFLAQGVNASVLTNAAGANAQAGNGYTFESLALANATTGMTVQSVSNASADHTHAVSMNSSGNFTTNATGGSEERPEAAVVMTCIRY